MLEINQSGSNTVTDKLQMAPYVLLNYPKKNEAQSNRSVQAEGSKVLNMLSKYSVLPRAVGTVRLMQALITINPNSALLKYCS